MTTDEPSWWSTKVPDEIPIRGLYAGSDGTVGFSFRRPVILRQLMLGGMHIAPGQNFGPAQDVQLFCTLNNAPTYHVMQADAAQLGAMAVVRDAFLTGRDGEAMETFWLALTDTQRKHLIALTCVNCGIIKPRDQLDLLACVKCYGRPL